MRQAERQHQQRLAAGEDWQEQDLAQAADAIENALNTAEKKPDPDADAA